MSTAAAPANALREQVMTTWLTNHRVNLFLIGKISEEGMRSTLSTRGGRDVARQFAHMHDVRVWHLQKRAKELAVGLKVFASKDSPSKAELKKQHELSAEAVGRWFARLAEPGVPAKGWKRGVVLLLGYFISHEAHHRGSILLTLKQAGHKLPQHEQYAIWDWNRI